VESSEGSSSNPLSAGALASLDKVNEKQGWGEFDGEYLRRVQNEERELERRRVRDAEEEDRNIRELEVEKERRRRVADKERRRQEKRERKEREALEERRLRNEAESRRRHDEESRMRGGEEGRRREDDRRRTEEDDYTETSVGEDVRRPDFDESLGDTESEIQREKERAYRTERERKRRYIDSQDERQYRARKEQDGHRNNRKRKEQRIISGTHLEKGHGHSVHEKNVDHRDGGGSDGGPSVFARFKDLWQRRKKPIRG